MKRIAIAFLLLALFGFNITNIIAQEIDTTKVFSDVDFLNWVRQYHPLMLQANLQEAKGAAKRLEAKGNFDPKAYGNYENKNFGNKNYFQIGEAGLKIPTWFGADVKLGYLWSNGVFLNPADQLPSNGQFIAGIEIPIGEGLIFDQRRAQVQQALLYQKSNLVMRQKMINDFLMEAIESYWKWAYQYKIKEIYATALNLSRTRFQNIQQSFLQGDKPAIDTLEAAIQVQNRVVQLEQANLDFQQATLEVSNFLWYKDLIPLEVGTNLRPKNLTSQLESVNVVIANSIIEKHPDLLLLELKQESLEIKEKLKREAFKPQVSVNYNFLGDGFQLVETNNSNAYLNQLISENYKWGIRATYPILLRKARGGLEFIQLEQLETSYKLNQKTLEIKNKIQIAQQGILNTIKQINIQEKTVGDYATLLAAEMEKFNIGESSIFLLNSREQKLIENQLKLIKLQTNYQKQIRKLDWAMGQLQ